MSLYLQKVSFETEITSRYLTSKNGRIGDPMKGLMSNAILNFK